MFVGVLKETWGVILHWKHQMNSLAKRYARGKWQYEETMYGAKPYLLYLKGLGGGNR